VKVDKLEPTSDSHGFFVIFVFFVVSKVLGTRQWAKAGMTKCGKKPILGQPHG
jgi:hypothetical protein